MATPDPHTAKAFDDDLEEIRVLIAQMGGMAEEAVSKATKALMNHDELAATEVVAHDLGIDRLSEEVEQHCIRLIALRAPLADDLRETLAAFKIAVIVERMGDCACRIAGQVPLVRGLSRRSSRLLVERMSSTAEEGVRQALDTFVARDADAAVFDRRIPDELSHLQDELLRDLLEAMTDAPSNISSCTSLLLASHTLVRLGEHAANLSRIACFAATGRDVPQMLGRKS